VETATVARQARRPHIFEETMMGPREFFNDSKYVTVEVEILTGNLGVWENAKKFHQHKKVHLQRGVLIVLNVLGCRSIC
jgi:hypothetical protein